MEFLCCLCPRKSFSVFVAARAGKYVISTSHNSLLYYWILLKLKLIYDRQSVGQSVLVSDVHLGPVANFSFSSKFPLDSCGFVIL
jgi:hypothetical protein